MKKIADDVYYKKVLGCFLGKSIGGTLGTPLEGWAGPHNLTFYDPVPTTMLPNDDLDLQVVWLKVLTQMKQPRVDSMELAKAWVEHVGFPWDEYAVAIRNIKNKIYPPFSGSYDNYFTSGMGCAIRSEIWACLADGDIDKAGDFAYLDGCVDHDSEGLDAEIFLARLEAAAFVEDDIMNLITLALEGIALDSKLREPIQNTINWYHENPSFDYLFDKIMTNYKSDNFTDVKINIPIMIAGLLLGAGDFDKTLCCTVNFGEDSDCTGATVGAIMGILAPEKITEKWLKPIGREIVLSPGIKNLDGVKTIDEMAKVICEMRKVIKADFTSLAQTYTPKKIKAKAVIRKRFANDSYNSEVEFDGNWCKWNGGKFDQHFGLALKFEFHIPKDGWYSVMFNSRFRNEVFIDEEFAFHRESGKVVPSFHRVPWNQSKFMELKAGKHTLEAIISMVPISETPEWIIGVADRESMQWVPDSFL